MTLRHYIISLNRPDSRQDTVPLVATSWDNAIAKAKTVVGWPEGTSNEVIVTAQRTSEAAVVIDDTPPA
jgi:hypothetical protein